MKDWQPIDSPDGVEISKSLYKIFGRRVAYCNETILNRNPIEKGKGFEHWYCTRKKGHSGPHAAGRGSTEVCLALWGNDAEVDHLVQNAIVMGKLGVEFD